MKSYFVDNGSVRIHVLESGVATPGKPSLLVIGGLWEPAERAIPILSGHSGHTVALSLRGRGLSSTPEHGYGLDDHLSDVDAVVRHCGLRRYCVLGFSRGASYALGWSLLHQPEMSGLILVDQPPVHTGANSAYVEYWSNLVYLGVPILNFMRRAALEGLMADARPIDFSPRLKELTLPVVLFAGRNVASPISSSLTDEDIETYRASVAGLRVVDFLKSGHMIPDVETEKYVAEITSFINTLHQ